MYTATMIWTITIAPIAAIVVEWTMYRCIRKYVPKGSVHMAVLNTNKVIIALKLSLDERARAVSSDELLSTACFFFVGLASFLGLSLTSLGIVRYDQWQS